MFIMRRKGALQLALQLNFLVIEDICNSLYLYAMNVNGQVAWVVGLQLIVYTVQLIVIQLQLNKKNSFLTTMQLHYNYRHDVMLASFIIVHLLKFNTRHYEDFWT
jgi:hypothetical protein